MRYLIFIVAIIASTAGFFGHKYLYEETWFVFKRPFPDLPASASLDKLGCKAIAEATAFEDKSGGPAAQAWGGQSKETIALRLSADEKTLSVLYGSDVQSGATEPILLNARVIRPIYLLASGEQSVGYTSLVLDLITLKAVINYTGQGLLGIKGGSSILQCR